MSGFWSFENLERITGGEWLIPPHAAAEASPRAEAAGLTGDPPGIPPHPTGLWHDTRDLQPGQAYLAIKGENHDGHRFVDDAFAKGASLAIVQDALIPRGPNADGWPTVGFRPILRVDDTVAALQDLASAYRDTLASGGCRVIAVCGSNGKTTTRHLIHHVLTACGLTGTQSPKSFNNHLGVPLTLLAARPGDDFVACELGTNHPGEIAALGEITWPDAAVITSIGREHLEFFKDLDGVAREEASILRFVRPHGLAVMPADVAALIAPYYDVQEGVVLMPILPPEAGGWRSPGFVGLPGEHNRMNAALVLALTRWLDLPAQRAEQALATAALPPGRLNVIHLPQDVTLLDDTYNANPDSMLAGLQTLAARPGRRRVAILGEMRELGSTSPDAHREIAEQARRHADHVVLIGRGFEAQEWSDDLPDRVVEQLRPGDTILLKASRGMRLERIIPAIEARFPT